MNGQADDLLTRILARFGARVSVVPSHTGEETLEVVPDAWVEVARGLRDEFGFEQLTDLCGVDYLGYGEGDWATEQSSRTGFSRARAPTAPVAVERRFAVVVHLLSVQHNRRLRLRAWCVAGDPPLIASLVDVWPAANWPEREAFDLYGVLFDGHPDLRRILTDYGFIGHPFRKDFPVSGHVEVRYDPEKGRVVYEPVSIEPRNNVPRVVRDDGRYGNA